MSSNWSDDEFLGYVAIHSQTERALFSGHMLLRLAKLADVEMPGVEDRMWLALHYYDAKPLIEAARKRLKT